MILVLAVQATDVGVRLLSEARLPLSAQEVDALCNTPDPLFIVRDDAIVMRYPPHTCIVAGGDVFVVCMTEQDHQFAEVLRWHLFGNGSEFNTEFNIDGKREFRDTVLQVRKRTSLNLRIGNTVDAVRKSVQLPPQPLPSKTALPSRTALLVEPDAAVLRTQKAVFETVAIFVEKMTESVLGTEADVQHILEAANPANKRIMSVQQLRDLKTCKMTVAAMSLRCAQLKTQLSDFADSRGETPAVRSQLALVGSTNFARILDELCACLTNFEYSMKEEEEFAAVQIDRQRNNLIYVTMVLTATTVSLSFVSMVAGIFGENVMPASVDSSPLPLFGIVNALSAAVGVIIFGGVMLFCHTQGITGS